MTAPVNGGQSRKLVTNGHQLPSMQGGRLLTLNLTLNTLPEDHQPVDTNKWGIPCTFCHASADN